MDCAKQLPLREIGLKWSQLWGELRAENQTSKSVLCSRRGIAPKPCQQKRLITLSMHTFQQLHFSFPSDHTQCSLGEIWAPRFTLQAENPPQPCPKQWFRWHRSLAQRRDCTKNWLLRYTILPLFENVGRAIFQVFLFKLWQLLGTVFFTSNKSVSVFKGPEQDGKDHSHRCANHQQCR